MGREDSRGLAGNDGWEGLTLNIAKGVASAYFDTCGSAGPWRRIIREGKVCKLLLLEIPGG